MSQPRIRHAFRRDKGELARVGQLVLAGARVLRLNGTPGLPDLLVGDGQRWLLVELKSAGGTLTKAQVQWWSVCGRQGPAVCCWPGEELQAWAAFRAGDSLEPWMSPHLAGRPGRPPTPRGRATPNVVRGAQ